MWIKPSTPSKPWLTAEQEEKLALAALGQGTKILVSGQKKPSLPTSPSSMIPSNGIVVDNGFIPGLSPTMSYVVAGLGAFVVLGSVYAIYKRKKA